MLEITKGYKKGRAVLFYDLYDEDTKETLKMVDKDKIVKGCQSGLIKNAKVQPWEGKFIVRIQGGDIPLVRVDDKGNVIGEAHKAVRNAVNTEKDTVIKCEVIGKLNNKSKKKETAYSGYSKDNLKSQYELRANLDYSMFNTIEDFIDFMIFEFRLKNSEEYKNNLSKKIKLNRLVASTPRTELLCIQNSVATYLMNMSNLETENTYLKFLVR